MHVLFTDKYLKDGSPAASSHNFRPKGRTTMPEPGILPFHDSFFARKSPRHQVFVWCCGLKRDNSMKLMIITESGTVPIVPGH